MKKSHAFLVGLLLACGARASFADTKDPTQTLFVGIRHRNSLHSRSARAITRRAEAMGEKLTAPARPLTRAEASCSAMDCLSRLSAERHIDWVLGGEILPIEGRDSLVTLWLFDARAGKFLEEGAPCNRCDDDALGEAAAIAAAKLLERRRAPPPPPVPAPTPAVTPVVPAPASVTPAPSAGPEPSESPPKSGFVPRFITGRRAAIAAMGAAFLASLSMAILVSLNPVSGSCPYTPTTGAGSTCSYQPFLQTTGFTSAGLLAAGLVFTIVLP